MQKKRTYSLEKLSTKLLVAAVLILFYMAWAQSVIPGNLLVVSVTAILISLLFTSAENFPRITVKKVAYSIGYFFYLAISIIKSNLDVAQRVVQPIIPINPGIVVVKTKLKSRVGRMILANSITLTPGTLTVDLKNDQFYIHWIDVTDMDESGATKEIVAGFEKYLEVIFG